MSVHSFSRRLDDEEPLDHESLLQTITSLREDLSSMKASMRRMLRENLELRQELGGRPREASVDELNRVRDEVDLFARLYDEPALPRRSRSAPRPRADGGRRDLLRSMMMMMMMSELL